MFRVANNAIRRVFSQISIVSGKNISLRSYGSVVMAMPRLPLPLHGVQNQVQTRQMSATSRLKKWKTKKHGKSLKTRQAVAKRFLLTGKGKLKHGHSGKRHNTSFKSMVRLRRLNKMKVLDGTQIARNIKKMIIR
jgi:large subunit ribosomal protein L35